MPYIQQVSVAGASPVCGRLVERLGERIGAPLPGSLHSLFPTANAIAAADVSVLNMPKARARAIIGFAQAVATGDLDLYAGESREDTRRRLQALPGIGPWSADLIAARAMNHTDAFPASDLSLRKSAARAFGHEEIISARELAQRSLSWRPWRTTAIAYLWMYPSSPVKVVGGNNL
ncbi:MAG: AraC family transcriptional regulator of adaptative response / DNA-3-methyladenine glycosylase II [Planctomycetota bacterium]|jgi:AraC family transcriptional regulator of adaptative response / DNA-3-methyladenine glycosylase II